jgi:hypothetical protein
MSAAWPLQLLFLGQINMQMPFKFVCVVADRLSVWSYCRYSTVIMKAFWSFDLTSLLLLADYLHN